MSEKTNSVKTENTNELTDEKLRGNVRRWRRFGAPTAAGQTLKEDGTPDYGLFGPGSVVWKVLLHPASIVFQSAAQWGLQELYKPVESGVRDRDPIARKARKGTFTAFDYFERLQRNSGMHAPMWLGDTETAERMWGHLYRIHQHVEGDVIDVGEPELGGYSAAGPRDEAPHGLPDDERDQYFRESAAYLELVYAPEDEIRHSVAEVGELFRKYRELFTASETAGIMPDTGQKFSDVIAQQIKANWHPTQQKALDLQYKYKDRWDDEVVASCPEDIQIWAGWDEAKRAQAAQKFADSQDEIREMQNAETEREAMELFWGPDGVELITAARELDARVRGQVEGAPVAS